jgi:hypothetical protein
MLKWLKKKTQPQEKLTSRGGFKIVPPPKDPERRAMLSGPDITASGGCRTNQHQPSH